MPRTRLDLRARFDAFDDAGNRYALRYFVEMVDATDSFGPQWVEGDPKIVMDDGTEVERQSKGEYLLRSHPKDIILRSTDPNAP
jgi:hypothetical protein